MPIFSSMKVYEYLAGVLIITAFGGFMYFKGYSGEHDKLVVFQQQVKDVGDAQAKKTAATDAANKKLAKDMEDEYHKNLAANTDYWARRLRNSVASRGAVSQAGPATGRPAQDTANALPDYKTLVLDCTATTVQLEALIEFEKNKH